MSVIAVSGLAASAWLGRRDDRSASRAPAFVALAAPAIGYLALTMTTSFAMLFLIGAAFLGAGMAAFPQLFTLARTHLDLSGGGSARRGTPAPRSVWSLAWAIGPMIGAAVLAWQGPRGLMALTALAFALIAGILAGATAQALGTGRHCCCAAPSAPSGACCRSAPAAAQRRRHRPGTSAPGIDAGVSSGRGGGLGGRPAVPRWCLPRSTACASPGPARARPPWIVSRCTLSPRTSTIQTN
jgi:MFS family permease